MKNRKVQIIVIPLLGVLVLLMAMGVGPCEDGEVAPRPGEWTASTGSSQFAFTFTVSPDSTGITEYYYSLTELECDGVRRSTESTVEFITIIAIDGGQFAIEDLLVAGHPLEGCYLTVQGSFDETGTHASGTWEISAEGTICEEGTWQASR